MSLRNILRKYREIKRKKECVYMLEEIGVNYTTKLDNMIKSRIFNPSVHEVDEMLHKFKRLKESFIKIKKELIEKNEYDLSDKDLQRVASLDVESIEVNTLYDCKQIANMYFTISTILSKKIRLLKLNLLRAETITE